MAKLYPRPAMESAMCHASCMKWPSNHPPSISVYPSKWAMDFCANIAVGRFPTIPPIA
jgi:hypothetical protein